LLNKHTLKCLSTIKWSYCKEAMECLISSFVSLLSQFSLACSSSYAAHNFVFREVSTVHFPNSFFYVKNILFFMFLVMLQYTLKNSCCCNTIKMRNISEKNELYVFLFFGEFRYVRLDSQDQLSNFLHVFFLRWSIKIFMFPLMNVWQ